MIVPFVSLVHCLYGAPETVALGVAAEEVSVLIDAKNVAEAISQMKAQAGSKSEALKRARIVVAGDVKPCAIHLKLTNCPVRKILSYIADASCTELVIDESGTGFSFRQCTAGGEDASREYYLSAVAIAKIGLHLESRSVVETRLNGLGIVLNVVELDQKKSRLILSGSDYDLRTFELLVSLAGLVDFSEIGGKE